MKWVAAGPVLGIIVGRGAMEKLAAAAGRSTSADVHRRIGVRPFINGRGTWTYLSGSLELPAVRRAKEAVKWDEAAFGLSVGQCDQELRAGEPRIEVLTASNPSLVPAVREGNPKSTRRNRPNRLQIVSMTLADGEELIVGRRLRQILSDARKRSAQA
jgi:hypothetical protein